MESLCAAVPAGGWELLVVDSACADATPAWLAEALPRLPVPARSLREERPGIARARNRALTEAAGGILLFLDDDCTVEPGWLAAHRVAFADPAVAGSGGRILPRVPAGTPRWLLPYYCDQHGGPGGRFDFGSEPCDLPVRTRGDLPFGANLGLRVAAARAVGGFDERLGWGAPENLPGEETDLMERLLRAGGRVRYAPQAVVYHHLPAALVGERQYLTYYRAVTTLQVERERSGPQRPRSLSTLAYRALRYALRACVARLAGQRGRGLEDRRQAIYWRARLKARLQDRLARRPAPG